MMSGITKVRLLGVLLFIACSCFTQLRVAAGDKLTQYIVGAVCRPDRLQDAAGRSVIYRENLHIYISNPGKESLKIESVRINGKDLQAEITADNILWYTINPLEVSPLAYGELIVRYMETGMAPTAVKVELLDAQKRVLGSGTVPVILQEPVICQAIGFEEDYKTIYLYISPANIENVTIKEVYCNGKKVAFGGEGILKKGCISPMVIGLSQPVGKHEFVMLELITDKGTSRLFSRVIEPFFSIGMYRCHRYGGNFQPAQRNRYERNFGKWAQPYLEYLTGPDRAGYAVPEWLDDCRKHLINTIAPDFTTWISPLKAVDLLKERDLRLVSTKYGQEIISYPGLHSLYLADEPAGIDAARSLTERLQKLRKSCNSGIPCKIVFCNLGCSPCDFTYIDAADFDTYPIGASAQGRPFGIGGGVRALREIMAPRPIGFVPQAFRSHPDKKTGGGWRRFPTPDEERWMVYSAVANGAKSITYFAYSLETYEPVEGVGTAALVGIPEAVNLWREIGRLNLELTVMGPWLMRSCVLKQYRTNGIEISVIGVGETTLIVIPVNHNYSLSKGELYEEFVPKAMKNILLPVSLPSYMSTIKSAFEVTYKGMEDLNFTITGREAAINLPALETGKIIVLTSASNLKSKMESRRVSLAGTE
jgi:hypothetical protein